MIVNEMVASTLLGDHQGRSSAPLIRCIKPLKYGALTNTLKLELDGNIQQCIISILSLKLSTLYLYLYLCDQASKHFRVHFFLMFVQCIFETVGELRIHHLLWKHANNDNNNSNTQLVTGHKPIIK